MNGLSFKHAVVSTSFSGVAALVILLSHADQINDLILGDEGVLNGKWLCLENIS